MSDDLAAEIARYVEKLGTGPYKIAASLSDLGFKGERDSNVDCPLARYLSDALGVTVLVGSQIVPIDRTDSRMAMVKIGPTMVISKTMPAVRWVDEKGGVDAFVHLFDQGEFPKLIDEPNEPNG